ncbi:hypothetical protein [Paenibacillus polymyxa]|uniref:Uncharacterized protein n=1 Tax=Paenibacillus polymyxa (strain SC2) TaxID=886882 RepID=E3EKI8_PAEPS|nr:hypothetical protein [Paenibacillus polymyxa]ADO59820.1 hypothetical protein PPSC2_26075 [Paenibacillus polymyxa SC2]WPQ59946.1 hypothetical protein SKN87_27270 [Paenibacillus polymyxa]
MSKVLAKIIKDSKAMVNLNDTVADTINNFQTYVDNLNELARDQKFREAYHLLSKISIDCEDAMRVIAFKLDGDIELDEEYQLTDAEYGLHKLQLSPDQS